MKGKGRKGRRRRVIKEKIEGNKEVEEGVG